MALNDLQERYECGDLVSVTVKSTGDSIQGRLHAIHKGKIVLLVPDRRRAGYQSARILDISSVKSVVPGTPDVVHSSYRFKRPLSNTDKRERPESITHRNWEKRQFLFGIFDEGIQLDEESWYSVTPEPIARHIASRLQSKSRHNAHGQPKLILDCCCGVGGNAIAFAHHDYVIGIDNQVNKLRMASHNASLYGVHQYLELLAGDCMKVMGTMPDNYVDFTFLSPPWGGPAYQSIDNFSIIDNIQVGEANGKQLFQEADRVSRSGVVYFLPKSVTSDTVTNELELEQFEIETHFVHGREFTTCIYFGQFFRC